MGKKSSGSAPAIDPRYYEAMEKQAQVLQKQQLWLENEIYPWMQSQANKQNQWAEEDRRLAMQNQAYWQDFAKKQYENQQKLADFYFDRYKNDIKPIEDSMIAQAKNYNTSAEAERQAGYAIADYQNAYANQRRQANMQMQAYGIDPTSGAYQAQNRAMDINQSAVQAAAANQARTAARELGWQKQAQVAALGQQYINNSNAATALGYSGAQLGGNLGQNALGQAAAYGQQGLNNIGQVGSFGLSGFGALSNGWGQYGNTAINASNYNLNAWNASQAQQTNRYASWWNNLNTASNILDKWIGNDAMYKQSAAFKNVMSGIGGGMV